MYLKMPGGQVAGLASTCEHLAVWLVLVSRHRLILLPLPGVCQDAFDRTTVFLKSGALNHLKPLHKFSVDIQNSNPESIRKFI